MCCSKNNSERSWPIRNLSRPLSLSRFTARCSDTVCLSHRHPHGHSHSTLSDEHGIAITVESVTLLHRSCVRLSQKLNTREGRHEHQQRRLRKMEIREECIHHAKVEPGCNEQAGFTVKRSKLPLVTSRGLQGPHDGRPDGYDPSPRLLRAFNRLHRLGTDIYRFSPHLMGFDMIHCHRFECRRADMQRDCCQLDVSDR